MRRFLSVLFLCTVAFPAFAFDAWDIANPNQKVSTLPENGKWQLISIWGLDCVACEKQKPKLSQVNRRYNNLSVFGVSIDGKHQVESIKKRLNNKPVSFPNAVVEYDDFIKQYANEFDVDFLATPTYILYQPNGQLRGIHTGPIDFSSLVSLIGK